MVPKIRLRPGTKDDLLFLKRMLLEAAYWRTDQERPRIEDVYARPDLIFLLEDWSREGDTAVIAVSRTGRPVGAAWYRFWEPELHSYGYVSAEIPEVAIAVRKAFRGRGIGHRLIAALLKAANAQGVQQVSLSVEEDNPAENLYRSHGFKALRKVDNAWIMVADTHQEVE